MLSSDAVNILELVAPPDNHVFHAGIWLSHDVDWRAVTDLLAPALTGVITAGRRQILETRAAVATDDPGLVVFHPGDRFTGGPVLPRPLYSSTARSVALSVLGFWSGRATSPELVSPRTWRS